MKLHLLAALAATVFLSACATGTRVPDRTQDTVLTSGRVGYVVVVPDRPVHTHKGTTIFNNFSRELDVQWNLQDEMVQALVEALERRGLTPVPVDHPRLNGQGRQSLTVVQENQWTIRRESEWVLGIAEDYRLDALVRVSPMENVLLGQMCTQFGCTSSIADGMGLYTEGAFGILQFFAVPAFMPEVIVFDPLTNLAMYPPLVNRLRSPNLAIRLKGFSRPEEFRNITAEELEPVREAIHEWMVQLADETATMFVTR